MQKKLDIVRANKVEACKKKLVIIHKKNHVKRVDRIVVKADNKAKAKVVIEAQVVKAPAAGKAPTKRTVSIKTKYTPIGQLSKNRYIVKREIIVTKSTTPIVKKNVWKQERVVKVPVKVVVETSKGKRVEVKIVKKKLAVKTIEGKEWRCEMKEMKIPDGTKKWVVTKRWRYARKDGQQIKLCKNWNDKKNHWTTTRTWYTTKVINGKVRKVRIVQRQSFRTHKYKTVRKSYKIVKHNRKYKIIRKRIGHLKKWKVVKIRVRVHKRGKWSLKTWGTTTGKFNVIHEYKDVKIENSKFIESYKFAKYRAYIKWVLTHKEWSTTQKINYIKFYKKYALTQKWSTIERIRDFKNIRKWTISRTSWTHTHKTQYLRNYKTFVHDHNEWNKFCVKYVIQHHPEWKHLTKEASELAWDVKKVGDEWNKHNNMNSATYTVTHKCPTGYTNFKNEKCVKNCPVGYKKNGLKCTKTHDTVVMTCPLSFTLEDKKCLKKAVQYTIRCSDGFKQDGNECYKQEEIPSLVCGKDQKLVNNVCIEVKCPTGYTMKLVDGKHKCQMIGCPANQVLRGNDCFEINCPKNFAVVGRECKRVACDEGFALKSGECFKIECEQGFVKKNNACEKVDCPVHQKISGTVCVDRCDKNSNWNGKTCEIVSCPLGYKLEGEKCVSMCVYGQVYDKEKKTCVEQNCSEGSVKEGGMCRPITCGINQFKKNGKCISTICTVAGEVFYQGECHPKSCPPGKDFVMVGEKSVCQSTVCLPTQTFIKFYGCKNNCEQHFSHNASG